MLTLKNYQKETLDVLREMLAAARYASPTAAFENSRTLAARNTSPGPYRPIPQFSIDAQGQFMFNRIYKTDARFLVGLSYWFFKKI